MMRKGASYKLACGYSMWDKGCGGLLDLEGTDNWAIAQGYADEAARLIRLTDLHRSEGRNNVVTFNKRGYAVMVRNLDGRRL